MRGRDALLLAPAFGLAMLVNVALFGGAALLTGERPLPRDITEPVPVSLVRLPAPAERERERTPPPPPPPRERPRLDFQPDLVPPVMGEISPPALEVRVVPQPLGPLGVPDLVFTEAELDSRPRPVAQPVDYPYRARQRGTEGEVTVRMLVHEDGTVSDVQILESRPPGVFDQAVLRSVPRWRFEPGRIDGENVASRVVTTISFMIER
ncbi:MAG: energy transducer TonB [Candidatus Krumholzibacteriia bacterium]